jgi:hypothetical protein
MVTFDNVHHNEFMSFFRDTRLSVSVKVPVVPAEHAYEEISIFDRGCKNSLTFHVGGLAIAERAMVADVCREVALASNGNIRKLIEHERILWLIKYADLGMIDHFSVKNQEITTLWTPEDTEALFADA